MARNLIPLSINLKPPKTLCIEVAIKKATVIDKQKTKNMRRQIVYTLQAKFTKRQHQLLLGCMGAIPVGGV